MANQTLSELILKVPSEIKHFDVVLAAKSIHLDIDPGDASWQTGVLVKTLFSIKQSGNSCGSKNSRQCHNSRNFGECTTAHNDLHRNRGFSPWQLLRGKTPTDKSLCENPDLARCSVEVVDEAAKAAFPSEGRVLQRRTSKRELSLRNRRKEIHQARPWRHWASGDCCWYWRAGKHRGATMKGGVFLGSALVLLQERETTDEGGSYERCCLDY